MNLDYRVYYEHHLAWLYETGGWPVAEIDHEDSNGEHNWFSNLRPATSGQNKFNTRLPSTNKSGFKGVCWCSRRSKWRVTVNKDRKQYHVGFFTDAAEGHAAWRAKAAELHGEYMRAA